MARCHRCIGCVPHTFTHGRSAYNYHGCRCSICVAANGARGVCAACRDGIPHEFTHGVPGYGYHRCRCDTCVSEYRRYHRERKAQELSDPARRADVNARSRDRYSTDPQLRRKNRRKNRLWHANNAEHKREYSRQYRDLNQKRVQEMAHDWRERNAPYVSDYTSRRYRRIKTSVPVSPSAGTRWTAEEDAVAASREISVMEAAYITGRSYKAVVQRRYSLRSAETKEKAE